jgi:ribosomal protein S18 acetylase RimI-like enzyme
MEIAYKPLCPADHADLYRLMESQEYMETALERMGLSREQFRASMHAAGEIHAIWVDGRRAGFRWVELRGRTLHLHGLVLEDAFQGQGIGTSAIATLAQSYQGAADDIELGVHASNQGAIQLYERLGFQTVRRLDDLGFLIMQKTLGRISV